MALKKMNSAAVYIRYILV